jgi:hypothetical protein
MSGSIQAGIQLDADDNFANDRGQLYVTVLLDREIKTTVSSDELHAAVNTSYDLTYTLTAYGRNAIDNVRFRLDGSLFDYGVIESIQSASGTCEPLGTLPVYCDFGTLNPGDVRTVVVRVRPIKAGTWYVFGNGQYTYNGNVNGNSSITSIVGAVAMEVQVASPIRVPDAITAGETGGGHLSFYSTGANLPQNFNATLEVAVPLRLTAVDMFPSAGSTASSKLRNGHAAAAP